ncbi:MAG: NAD(P)/FAD-dependent oxidoreductase [Syntrophaceae bacterium]|nr:NAD(P)/FAD-dependent oxidoreductase [Syntrophaceae bacterium]
MGNRFDVIIIGAGPAGIACAQALAGSRLSVLVLEKNETIGPKACAGGLTRTAVGFGVPRDRARLFPEQVICIGDLPPFRIALNHPMVTVSRADLARHHLAGLEKAPNIEIAAGVKATGLSDGTVSTTRGAFSFRHLVAADGSQSLVRRHLGLPTRFGVGLYYEVPRLADEVRFHFKPTIFRSGFLWVFPHRDCTNVGIGFNPERLTAGLAKVILQQFVKEMGFAADGVRLKGGTISHLYRGLRFGNIFLAGDAAGLASRATGEGIPFALVSGREIGRALLEPGYRMPELSRMLAFKRRQERYWGLFEALPRAQKTLLAAYLTMMKRPWMQAYMGY